MGGQAASRGAGAGVRPRGKDAVPRRKGRAVEPWARPRWELQGAHGPPARGHDRDPRVGRRQGRDDGGPSAGLSLPAASGEPADRGPRPRVRAADRADHVSRRGSVAGLQLVRVQGQDLHQGDEAGHVREPARHAIGPTGLYIHRTQGRAGPGRRKIGLHRKTSNGQAIVASGLGPYERVCAPKEQKFPARADAQLQPDRPERAAPVFRGFK